jgi:hypothetical protein
MRRYAVHLAIAALAFTAIGLGLSRPTPAAPKPGARTDAVAYWMRRARAAEARTRSIAAAAARARIDERAQRVHRPSSLEAIRLAAITSTTSLSEREAMYRTLYRLAACETTGTVPAPWPPVERVLDHRAQNQTGERARGLLQFLPSTWRTTPYAGESMWSPYAQALAAAWMVQHGRLREWACRWATR